MVATIRLQKSDLPGGPWRCPKDNCVYNEGGMCDNPRINKGNSDAKCTRMTNRAVIKMLNIGP